MPVYVSANNNENMVTFNELNDISQRMITKLWPFTDTVWYPSNISVENRLLYKFLSFFLHRIPGWIIDLLLLISGREPM